MCLALTHAERDDRPISLEISNPQTISSQKAHTIAHSAVYAVWSLTSADCDIASLPSRSHHGPDASGRPSRSAQSAHSLMLSRLPLASPACIHRAVRCSSLLHTARLTVASTATPLASRAMASAAAPASASASAASALPAGFSLDARSHSALSHALSKVLRHTAPSLGLSLDSAGYAVVADLLALPTFRRLTPQPTLQALQYVAAHCPKQRFGIVYEQQWKIRANQGHNAAFAQKLDAAALLEPLQIGGPMPAVCMHGTSLAGWAAIAASGGLHPMGRSHIHFSSKDFGAADLVSGMRNSSEILISIDLQRCLSWAASPQVKARNGELQFFRSANDVVLTAGVTGLSGYLPSFLFERVEEVIGSGKAANKERRELAGWKRPTEEQWMAQFAHSLAPPAAAEATAAPRHGARVAQDLSSGSASDAASVARTRPSRWGPPPTSRPPANWVVPEHLAHIAAQIVASEPAVAAASASATAAAGASAARPASNSQPFEYLVVLDFEATCDESSNGSRFGPQEVIEFPLVVIDVSTGETKATFRRYVTPQVHPKLTPFCTGLTGITNAMVAPESGALPFGTVWTQVEAFLREQNLLPPLASSSAASSSAAAAAAPYRWAFVTCGDWDLRTMLPAQLSLLGVKKHEIPSHYTSWINLKPTFNSFYQPKIEARGMADMLHKLNLPLVGRHHSGLDDCKNIAQIVCRMIDDGCTFKLTQQRREKAAATQAAQDRAGAATPASVVSFASQPQPAAAPAPAASSARGPSALQSALLRGGNQSRFQ